MAPTKEEVCKAKLATLKVKINSYTDVDLTDAAERAAAANDVLTYRHTLGEIEDVLTK